MEQAKIETRKFKIEIEIPCVYYEALIANPSLESSIIIQEINASAIRTLDRIYNNKKVLPTALRKYLEARYGIPYVKKTDEKSITISENKEKSTIEE